MGQVISIHTESIDDGDTVSPSKISRKWRRVGNQIRGRVSSLVAAKHGKKQLRPGTPERLRSEILERCRILEEQKKLYENPPELYKEIIKAFGRKEGLFRNRNSGNAYKPYNEQALQELLTIGSSVEEVRFVETFLEICGVKRDVFKRILIPQLFSKDFNDK